MTAMHFVIVFTVLAFLALACSVFDSHRRGAGWSVFFLMLSLASFIAHKEDEVEARNRETCTYLGVVTEVVCAVDQVSGKYARQWAVCRVQLDNNTKVNLSPATLALKGDKVSFCKNSEKQYSYRDHHKVE